MPTDSILYFFARLFAEHGVHDIHTADPNISAILTETFKNYDFGPLDQALDAQKAQYTAAVKELHNFDVFN